LFLYDLRNGALGDLSFEKPEWYAWIRKKTIEARL
jgi:hypothetical protein